MNWPTCKKCAGVGIMMFGRTLSLNADGYIIMETISGKVVDMNDKHEIGIAKHNLDLCSGCAGSGHRWYGLYRGVRWRIVCLWYHDIPMFFKK